MPDKKFLEEFPLYRKFEAAVEPWVDYLPKVAINMPCAECKSNQTFKMVNEFGPEGSDAPGSILWAEYQCQHCNSAKRTFFILADRKKKWFMKVGQYPAWDIRGDAEIERLLGEHAEYFKRGLICESQGYGIGAFGYYRRIVENIIDELLAEIGQLMIGEELHEFQGALEKTKHTTVAQDKIELVKELLPPILRPNGMNPLSVLHTALSEGLHAGPEELCLEQAAIIRQVLVYLVNEVKARKVTANSFTAGMRKLLEKRKGG
ncbi:MAG: hypothetical protein ABSB74_03860 [Tepidisphaeraceae bacterium]